MVRSDHRPGLGSLNSTMGRSLFGNGPAPEPQGTSLAELIDRMKHGVTPPLREGDEEEGGVSNGAGIGGEEKIATQIAT